MIGGEKITDLETCKASIAKFQQIAKGVGAEILPDTSSTTLEAFILVLQQMNLILPEFGLPQIEFNVSTELDAAIVLSQQLASIVETVS